MRIFEFKGLNSQKFTAKKTKKNSQNAVSPSLRGLRKQVETIHYATKSRFWAQIRKMDTK